MNNTDNNTVKIKKKKTKTKCGACIMNENNEFIKCTSKKNTIIGYCSYCEQIYCTEHRLPEAHYCPKLSKCKETAFKKNATLVENGKCVAAKV